MPERSEIHLDVAAYALGSLEPDERARFARHLETCPRCRLELEQFEQVAGLLAAPEPGVAPPPDLRERTLRRVAADATGEPGERPTPAPGLRRSARIPRRLALGTGLATALAVAVAVVTLLLPSGTPGAPTLGEAARLAGLPETVSDVTHAHGAKLVNRSGAGVPFPNWHRAFGWKAAGGRADDLEDRTATTTFYQRVRSARRVAYTVVSGDALALPADTRPIVRGDRTFHVVREGGRAFVAFERLGHTCVLSGEAGVEEMIRLAAWTGGGAVPF